jgi:hypothetical protein
VFVINAGDGAGDDVVAATLDITLDTVAPVLTLDT